MESYILNKIVQVDIVDPPVNCEGDECERTHKYYQWVAVVAVLQVWQAVIKFTGTTGTRLKE